MAEPEVRFIFAAALYGYICFWTGLLLAWWWRR